VKYSAFRKALEGVTSTSRADSAERLLNDLLASLKRFDDRDVEEVIKMFALLKSPRPASAAKDASAGAVSAEEAALAEMREKFDDDAGFRDALRRLKDNKSITREGLNRLYNQLFDKSRALAAKATRDKLILDIGDLRVERVRSKRAAEYFAGRAAE
jgi:ribosomal protein L12E/L44/L45/RPP1/RPP2